MLYAKAAQRVANLLQEALNTTDTSTDDPEVVFLDKLFRLLNHEKVPSAVWIQHELQRRKRAFDRANDLQDSLSNNAR